MVELTHTNGRISLPEFPYSVYLGDFNFFDEITEPVLDWIHDNTTIKLADVYLGLSYVNPGMNLSICAIISFKYEEDAIIFKLGYDQH